MSSIHGSINDSNGHANLSTNNADDTIQPNTSRLNRLLPTNSYNTSKVNDTTINRDRSTALNDYVLETPQRDHQQFFSEPPLSSAAEFRRPPVNTAFNNTNTLRHPSRTPSTFAGLTKPMNIRGTTLNQAPGTGRSNGGGTEFSPLLKTVRKPQQQTDFSTIINDKENNVSILNRRGPARADRTSSVMRAPGLDTTGVLSYEEMSQSMMSLDMNGSRELRDTPQRTQDKQRTPGSSTTDMSSLPLRAQEDQLKTLYNKNMDLKFKIFMLEEFNSQLKNGFTNSDILKIKNNEMELKTQMKELQHSYIQLKRSYEQQQKEHELSTSQNDQLRGENRDLNNRVRELEEKLKQQRNSDDDSQSTAKDDPSIHIDIKELERQLKEKDQDIQSLEDQLEIRDDELADEKERVRQLEEELNMLEEKQQNPSFHSAESMSPQEAEEHINELQGTINALKAKLNRKETDNTDLGKRIEEAEEECQAIQEEKEHLARNHRAAIEKLRNELDDKEDELSEIKQREQELLSKQHSQSEKFGNNQKEHNDTLEHARRQVSELKHHNVQLTSKVSALEKENNQFKTKISNLEGDRIIFQASKSNLDKKISKLERELDFEKQQKSDLERNIERTEDEYRTRLSAKEKELQALRTQASSTSQAQTMLADAVKDAENLRLDLQIVRNQLSEADQKLIQRERSIDSLKSELANVQSDLREEQSRANTNSINTITRQQYNTLENKYKDQKKVLDFLENKIKDLQDKATDNENLRASLQKDISKLQDQDASNRAALAKLSKSSAEMSNNRDAETELHKHADTINEQRNQIKDLEQKLKTTNNSSNQQQRVLEIVVEELLDLEQMIRQPWFLQMTSPSSKFDWSSQMNKTKMEKELERNDTRGDILIQCLPNKYPHSRISQSSFGASSNKLAASEIMSQFSEPSTAEMASRLLVALGELRVKLGSKASELIDSSSNTNSKQQSNKVLDELKNVVDFNVTHYQKELETQNSELLELKSLCKTYKKDLTTCQTAYDQAQSRLMELEKEVSVMQRGSRNPTTASKAQDILAEQLSETKAELRRYQEKVVSFKNVISELKQKLEFQESDQAKKLDKIIDRADAEREHYFNEYQKSIHEAVKRAVEDTKEKRKREFEKMDTIIQKYKIKLNEQEQEIAALAKGSSITRPSSQREMQLTAAIKTLIAQSKHLRAKLDRESSIRGDLTFMKQFFMQQISAFKVDNLTTLELLRRMGIYVDHEKLRRDREMELAENQRLKEEYSRPRTYGNYNEVSRKSDLYYRNVALGKRRIIKASQIIIFCSRLRKRVEERKVFEKSRKNVRHMVAELTPNQPTAYKENQQHQEYSRSNLNKRRSTNNLSNDYFGSDYREHHRRSHSDDFTDRYSYSNKSNYPRYSDREQQLPFYHSQPNEYTANPRHTLKEKGKFHYNSYK